MLPIPWIVISLLPLLKDISWRSLPRRLPRLFQSSTTTDHNNPPLAELSVISWNILAPTYVRHKGNDGARHLDWSYREPRILDLLAEHAADVVCLQEVPLELLPQHHNVEDSPQTNLTEAWQQMGYQTYIVQNTTRGLDVATVLLLHDHWSWNVVRVESRSRALLVTLQHRKKGGNAFHVFIANVHLQAKPAQALTRFYQVKSLLRRLQLQVQRAQLTEKDPYMILLLGDWNAMPTDPLHVLLTTGELPDNQDHDWPQLVPNLPLLPLRDIHNRLDNDPTDDWTHNCGAVLDYIFVSPQVQVVNAWTGSPDEQRMVQRPIPSRAMPSDHLPIGGLLRLLRPDGNFSGATTTTTRISTTTTKANDNLSFG